MRNFHPILLILLVMVWQKAAGQAGGLEFDIVSWNVQSGGAKVSTVAKQMTEDFEGIELWGLSEVANDQAAQVFENAAEEGENTALQRIVGTTGAATGDLLAILFDSGRFELVKSYEVKEINVGGTLRAPLVAHFKGKKSGTEFLFMVNHLSRINNDKRHQQAQMLNAWGAKQALPVIAVGDYNFDWHYQFGDDPGSRDKGFDLMTGKDVWEWVRPELLVPTNSSSHQSVLDFVFTRGSTEVKGLWSVVSKILIRPDDFPDDNTTSDHRPVLATISYRGADPAAVTAPIVPQGGGGSEVPAWDSSAPNIAKNQLRIGAWNIENLGTRWQRQKAEDLAQYILESGVDILALEEIHDDDQKKDEDPGKAPWRNAVLDQVAGILGEQTEDGWDYQLTDPSPVNGRVQMTGVLWRTSKATLKDRFRLPVKGGNHDGVNGLTYWTRRPEAFFFKTNLPSVNATDLIVVPLHMKSNQDDGAGSEMRLLEAQQLIEALPALKEKFGAESDLVLLGDTNINRGERDVQKAWKDFTDLNSAEVNTWNKPKSKYLPAPFDRIFIPKGQPEFATSKQVIHGPYPHAGQSEAEWFTEHVKRRSDHMLIWCDVKIGADDD